MDPGFLTVRRRWVVAAAFVGGGLACLAPPAVYEVEGVSMAPGLLPGDRVASGPLPLADRLRPPRRFDRWAVATADAIAIKRIVGLPGEEVAIAGGDLVIDGTTVLKGPRLLAAIGSPLPAPPSTAGRWSLPPREILDDDPRDTGRSVALVPVRDVGFAAVMEVDPVAGAGVRVRAGSGATVVTWRLAGGRHAIVAGRLDGHAVAVAWCLGGRGSVPIRSCLPSDPPHFWSAAEPWPETAAPDDRTPRLELVIEPPHAAARIERIDLWRDVCWRGAADGRAAWTVGPDAVFVLGDHPPASRDSRHWGPLPVAALRHRVARVVPAVR